MDNKTTLDEQFVMSDQLAALKNAELETLSVVDLGDGVSQLQACDVIGKKSNKFLDLFVLPAKKFYIRERYSALYQKMLDLWAEPQSNKVTLLGNAGTGKSWFQVYVLRELLTANPLVFNFVVRHVGTQIYLIDLVYAKCYQWKGVSNQLLDQLRETLYMYEPAEQIDQSPLFLDLPSLSTLSPYTPRIKEYKKMDEYRALYFWPWSMSEMFAVAQDCNMKIDIEEILRRRFLFGGIVRHVLSSDQQKNRGELTDRLATEVKLETLQSMALNIDRVSQGYNVSGYIVCYNDMEDLNRFDERILEYTSAYVESEVEKLLDAKEPTEQALVVLARLNNEFTDLSGKNLEGTVAYLFSQGSHYKWQAKKVNSEESWSDFEAPKKQRDLRKRRNIHEELAHKSLILVPQETTFPGVDVVFSQGDDKTRITAVQFTWQVTHPFTARALYELHRVRLKLKPGATLKVYICSPGNEDIYVTKTRDDFLKGRLDTALQYSKQIKVKPRDLRIMWDNTEIHVLRPKDIGWKVMLGDFIGGKKRQKSGEA